MYRQSSNNSKANTVNWVSYKVQQLWQIGNENTYITRVYIASEYQSGAHHGKTDKKSLLNLTLVGNSVGTPARMLKVVGEFQKRTESPFTDIVEYVDL